jgi:hypothetical protein
MTRFLLILATVLTAGTASAQTIRYNCLPHRVTQDPKFTRVLCSEPKTIANDFRQGFPSDAGGRVDSFAIPTTDARGASFAYLVNLAQMNQLIVHMVYPNNTTNAAINCINGGVDPSRLDAAGNPSTYNCRIPSEFYLMAEGQGTLPFIDTFPRAYNALNLTGGSQEFRPGIYEAARGELSVGNDAIRSLSVPAGFRVVICVQDSYLHENAGDLGLCRYFGPGTWNTLGNDLNAQGSLVAVFGGVGDAPSAARAFDGASLTGRQFVLGLGMREAVKAELQIFVPLPSPGHTDYYNDLLKSLQLDAGYRAIACSNDSAGNNGVNSLGVCRYYVPGTYNSLGTGVDGKVSLTVVSRR